MKALITYLEQYGLISLEKQEKLSALAGDFTTEIDFETGRIRLSSGYEFPFQVLGTESDNTLTWLWAWAEEQSEVPPELLASALEMRAWGEKEGIAECTSPSVDLERADGLLLSLIASEVCKASCYYQDSYDGGALFLLLFGQTIEMQEPLDAGGVVRQISHLASLYDFNHRNALLSYLRYHGLTYEGSGQVLLTRLESGEELQAEFGPDEQLLSINGRPLLV
jgi:hypothetical protein